jgi:hypothetical protein
MRGRIGKTEGLGFFSAIDRGGIGLWRSNKTLLGWAKRMVF